MFIYSLYSSFAARTKNFGVLEAISVHLLKVGDGALSALWVQQSKSGGKALGPPLPSIAR